MRGPNTDLKQQILDRIDAQMAAVWTPVDFLDLGARPSVDKTLQRLAAGGDIHDALACKPAVQQEIGQDAALALEYRPAKARKVTLAAASKDCSLLPGL